MNYLSFLMGGEDISDEQLSSIGVEIVEKESDGNRKLKVPSEKLDGYLELIKKSLTAGFWNEVVGEDKIVFVFKSKDGSTKEYRLSPENELEIDRLAAEFVGQPLGDKSNVYKWLSENKFYHDFMTEHYGNMINR